MILALALLAAGTVLLTVGADRCARGAARLAVTAGIPAFALGALLFGVDLEGLATAVTASARGQGALAAGEIFGTILFLFGLAFAVALLVSPEPVPTPGVAMVLAPAVPVAGAALSMTDGLVDRIEGGLLLALYVGYVAGVFAEGRSIRRRGEEPRSEVPRGAGRPAAATLAASLAALYAGAWLLVDGGVRALEVLGLEAGFVGTAALAVLTSLDEAFLEVLPVRRRSPGLATGNLLGTVAAFCSGVLGVTALVRPLRPDLPAGLAFLCAAAMYALVAVVFVVRGRAGRALGAALIGSYVAWLVLVWRVA